MKKSSVINILAALLVAGCGLPLETAAPVVRNSCAATSDCGDGAACAPVRGHKTCVATSIDLAGLILEVRPSPGAAVAPETSYLIDPANPGMNEFSQDPFQVRGTNPAGIVQSFDLRLPKLVTVARGLVQANETDAKTTCTLGQASVAADVELQRVSSYVGLPPARYSATTSAVTVDAAPANAFHIAVPPDTYHVYVAPKVSAAAGSSDCQLPALPPAYFPSQLIAHDADLNITLPPLKHLAGTLEVPKGASVGGWRAELVEPGSGKIISTLATLSGDAGTTVDFQLDYYWTFKASPILRLRPPSEVVGPTVYWELASVDLSGGGQVALTLYELDAQPKHIEAGVVDSDGAPVAASIEIQSTSLSGLTNASYRFTTETTSDGAFTADLPLGDYRVLARPTLDRGLASSQALTMDSWTIRAEDLCCGRTVELIDRAELGGRVVDGLGRPITLASIVASPSLPGPLGYLANALGLSPVLPREATAQPDADGVFTLAVDAGQFDLSVRPPSGSLFPWIVRSRVSIAPASGDGPARSDLGDLVGEFPAVVLGTIEDSSGSPIAGAVVRAWLPLADPITNADSAGTVIQVVEATTDSQGRYVLPLPTSIAR